MKIIQLISHRGELYALTDDGTILVYLENTNTWKVITKAPDL